MSWPQVLEGQLHYLKEIYQATIGIGFLVSFFPLLVCFFIFARESSYFNVIIFISVFYTIHDSESTMPRIGFDTEVCSYINLS